MSVLPDKSLLIGQKLLENAKDEKFKWDILSNFQTLCGASKESSYHSSLFEVEISTVIGLDEALSAIENRNHQQPKRKHVRG